MKICLSLPLLLALAALSCRSTDLEETSGALVPEMGDYTFVFLETGPNQDLEEDALSDAFAGHFENMERLAEEDLLLMAGPFADPKADPAHRGLLIFDVANLDEAEQLVETDPAVQAGALGYSIFTLSTTSPMRSFLDYYRTAAEELGEEPGMLSYVLVSTRSAELARRTMAERPELVFFHGQFGGDRAGQWLLALNVRSKEEAHALLERGDWIFYPWWSTETHVRALKP